MPILYCEGKRLKKAIIAGTKSLTSQKNRLNKLNVFPVPDGDTGTNMAQTLSSVIKEMENIANPTLHDVAKAAAWGALTGARGNSGVILAQIFAGFAENAEIDRQKFYAADIAESFRLASTKAYQAVINPVEGTILTVLRESAEIAVETAENAYDLVELLDIMVKQAKISVANTPQLLPILKTAGVIDAGGLGLVFFLEGMLKLIRGEEIVTENDEAEVTVSNIATLGLQHDWRNRYCTEFMIEGNCLSAAEIKDKLTMLGDSLLVTGNEKLMRIHIHTANYKDILSQASSYGKLSQVKVDDMMQQHQQLVMEETKPISTIAVALGDGLREIFKSLKVDKVIEGGQTMNPPVGQLLDAINELPSEKVILLPNNSNVIATALQAAKLSSKEVSLVNSKSIPEGLSALLAFRQDLSVAENIKQMEEVMLKTKTGEVTISSRDLRYDDLNITTGDFIGIYDQSIKTASKSASETLSNLLNKMVEDNDEIITIFYGKNISLTETEKLINPLKKQFPAQEIEIHYGGQPHGYFIISVE